MNLSYETKSCVVAMQVNIFKFQTMKDNKVTFKEILIWVRGHSKILHSRMTENMLGFTGNLFMKCMQQVTKGHLYHLLLD